MSVNVPTSEDHNALAHRVNLLTQENADRAAHLVEIERRVGTHDESSQTTMSALRAIQLEVAEIERRIDALVVPTPTPTPTPTPAPTPDPDPPPAPTPVAKRQVTPSDFRVLAQKLVPISSAPGAIVFREGKLLVQTHQSADDWAILDAETLEATGDANVALVGTAFLEFQRRVEAHALGTRAQIADAVFGHGWLVVSFWAYYNTGGDAYPKVYCRHLESGLEIWARPQGEIEQAYGVQVFGGGLCVLSDDEAARRGGRRFACGWDPNQGIATASNGPAWLFFDPEKTADVDGDGVEDFLELAAQFHPYREAHPKWNQTTKLRDRFFLETDTLRGFVQVGSTGTGEIRYKRDAAGNVVSGGYFSADSNYVPLFVVTSEFGRTPKEIPASEVWHDISALVPKSSSHKRQQVIAGCAHDPVGRRVWLSSPWYESGQPLITVLEY